MRHINRQSCPPNGNGIWSCRSLLYVLGLFCTGNPALPTAMVVSFHKARGTASLVPQVCQ